MRTGMDLGGLLMDVVAVLTSASVSSFPGIPLRPDTHRTVVGPGQVLRSDLMWCVTGYRDSIALGCD